MEWLLFAGGLAAAGYTFITIQEDVFPVRLLFLAVGLLIVASSGLIARRLRQARGNAEASAFQPGASFVVLWLALEVAGYFLLTPFQAVRRLLGVLVVAALAAATLAAATGRSSRQRWLLRAVVAGNAVLGLGYYLIDWRDARAQQQAAALVMKSIDPAPGVTVWFVGHHGFQFYAERQGMRPFIQTKDLAAVKEGDWLVVPDGRVVQQGTSLRDEDLERGQAITIEDGLPFGVIYQFYGGAMPLKHLDGPRLKVGLYRILRPLRASHQEAP
jgi:hypothetical protein